MLAFLRGLAILIVFYFAGVAIETYLNVPLPANVIGMILLAAALFAGLVKLEWIESGSRFMLRHMSLFFVPAIVGTIAFADRIGEHWIFVVLGIVPGTLLVMAATGLVTKALQRKEESPDDAARMAE
ncbi:CidA/LrgA family protein [Paenibacillaceae bacterium WGS1546]|uniref:CidA/LrgA family protein n=1 Tax=Cohnella sp. WGS1546 TaxID=3366810 RepID=UPI00372CEA6C